MLGPDGAPRLGEAFSEKFVAAGVSDDLKVGSHSEVLCATHYPYVKPLCAPCTILPASFAGVKPDTENKAPAARLRQAREAKGLADATAGAAFLGVNQTTYLQHENGTRPFKRAVDHYAARYDVSPEWLLWGRESPARKRTVPLVGYVAAGSEAHFYSSADSGLDEVEAPAGSTENTRAAEIRGTSLGPLFERWLIFYDDVRTPVTPDLIGKLCIVGLPGGMVLVKKLKSSPVPGFFHLESNTEPTLNDQEVLWAALVKQMMPR